jgi:ADP-ribose pyrophosphatase YjhB (NUDIX family)
LEQGESLVQACAREALEETAHTFTPTDLLGVYMSRFQRPATGEDITYLRFAFRGSLGAQVVGRQLDEGIVRAIWLTPQEIRASHEQHRSPLVLRCLEDWLSGRSLPLDAVTSDQSIWR